MTSGLGSTMEENYVNTGTCGKRLKDVKEASVQVILNNAC